MTLTCRAYALPEPTFTWITPDGKTVNATTSFYENKTLDDGSEYRRGKILQQDGSLLIFGTIVQDQGTYKCMAINDVGMDKRKVTLTVSKGKKNTKSQFTFLLLFRVGVTLSYFASYRYTGLNNQPL